MNLCRCPYCNSTFQLDVPSDSDFWFRTVTDDMGTPLWVCSECHLQGKPELDIQKSKASTQADEPDVSHLIHQALRPNM